MRIVCPPSLTLGWLAGKQKAHLISTFIVKGTFKLKHGENATPLKEAEQVVGDIYEGEGPGKELFYPSDMVPFKPRTDLLLQGDAQLPGSQSTVLLPVQLRVGDFSKELLAIGNRRKNLAVLVEHLSEPDAFSKIPVSYRYALGGAGYAKNPIGRGFADGDTPNLEYPKSVRATTEPAGFAPIPEHWEQRRRLVGSYDERWLKERWPWFPDDFDWGYFNAAPADQQLPTYLRGDEALEFRNLHPEHSVYRSQLPGLRTRCFLSERTREGLLEDREVPMHLDTLFVNLRSEKLVLVWRGNTPVRTVKLREIEHVLVATEPLSESPKPLDHYRTLIHPTPEEEAEEPESDARDAQFEKSFAEMDQEFAQADREFAELQKKAEQAEQDHMAKALETDENRGVWDRGKNPPSTFDELKQAFAAQLAELRQSNPEHAEALEQLEIGSFAQMEAKLNAAEKEMDADQEIRHTRESVQSAVASGKSLAGQDLSKLDLSGLELGKASLAGAALNGANLENAKLRGADLTDAELRKANLKNADLTGAVLKDADLSGAALQNTKVAGAIFDGATLAGLDLKGIDFSGCTGIGADLSRADLTGALFIGAKFPKADFCGCRLEKCNFSSAELQAGQFEHIEASHIIFTGADITGLHGSGGSNFAGGNFQNARANRAIFEQSNLEGADLTRALLYRSQFAEANLRGAVLDRADLGGAVFDDAILERAVLTNAQLLRASFDRADLTNTSFAGSNLYDAGFWETRINEFTDFRYANLKGTTLG